MKLKRIFAILIATCIGLSACSSNTTEVADEDYLSELTEEDMDELIEELDESEEIEEDVIEEETVEEVIEEESVEEEVIEEEVDLSQNVSVSTVECSVDNAGNLHYIGTITNNNDVAVDVELNTYANVTYYDDYGDLVVEEDIDTSDYWGGTKSYGNVDTDDKLLSGSFEFIEPGETRSFEYVVLERSWTKYKSDTESVEYYSVVVSCNESVEGSSWHQASLESWNSSTNSGTFSSYDGDSFEFSIDSDGTITVVNNSDHYISNLYVKIASYYYNSDNELSLILESASYKPYIYIYALSGFSPNGDEGTSSYIGSYAREDYVNEDQITITYLVDVNKE